MENTKKFDIYDLITPELLAHYFNAKYKSVDRVTFSYVTKPKDYKVFISKCSNNDSWRIWVYHYCIEESKTVLKTINELITALMMFGVPSVALKIQHDCLTPKK